MDMIGIVEGSFEWALMFLKNGSRIARKGWKGKGMFLYLTTGSNIKSENMKPETRYNLYGDPDNIINETIKINSHIDMRTANGSITIGWNPSQVDMMTNDWEIIR